MEDITHADCAHVKRVREDFAIKNLGQYHDLYVQSDTLLIADVFKNFWNMCLEIYELNRAKVISVPGSAWQATFKKTKGKLDLLIDIDMLLMVKKGIRGGICHSTYWYAKANNKHMKDYDKYKESLYQYWDRNNLYSWAMSKKLSVYNFEWIEDTFQFNKDFIRNCNKESVKGIFSNLMFNILKTMWTS